MPNLTSVTGIGVGAFGISLGAAAAGPIIWNEIAATTVQSIAFCGAHSTGINNFANGVFNTWGANTQVKGWGYFGWVVGYINRRIIFP